MNSLQDQLLNAGLVDAKKAKQVKKEKRKKDKVQRKSKENVLPESKLMAQQALSEKTERDRQLNAERQKIAEKKAIAAQVKQLIEMNRKPRGKDDLPYNFVDDAKVKTIHVSTEIQDQLSRGILAIVKSQGNYELVPTKVAEKISLRDPEAVIVLNERSTEELDDDPYADYQIPDDLMW